MFRIPYLVLAKAQIDQSCSGRVRARILSSARMARSVSIRLGLLCAVIVPMASVAEAGILGVSWQLDANARAEVDHQRPDPYEPVEIHSSSSDSADVWGRLTVDAVAVATEDGTTASGATITDMSVSRDLRSGGFSSNSRAGNSVGGLYSVSYGAEAYGGGHVEWETDDTDGELSVAYGYVSSDDLFSNAFIRFSGTGTGGNEYRIPSQAAAFGMITEKVTSFSSGFRIDTGAAVTTYPDRSNSTGFAAVWGRNGLPGLSATDPFMPQAGASTNIFNFTIPVMQDYGIGNTLYFDPVFATGYEYRVDGSRFASFTLPGALPGGDDLFQLEFNGVFYDLMAGNVFDFTSIDPLGASQFFLRGIDPSEMIDPNLNPPFVSGLSFTTQGIADVSQIALTSDVTAVPEPSSFCIMMALMGIAGAYRWRTITSA